NHVIAAAAGGGGQIAVTFNTGKTVSATIVGRDTVSDLAVIKVSGVSGLTPASLGSSASLVVGQPVVAVGSPLGLSGTVTSGIVSALHRPVSTAGAGAAQGTVFDAIQTDAPINPGNSGGPLVNLSGQVVGINSAIATLGTSNPFGSSGQSGSIGLGFSIPIDTARPIAAQLIKTGTASYALLGVEISNATSSQVLPDCAQVRVVQSGSPAAKAGLKVGDVITGLGSLRIDSADALIAAVHAQQPGSTVTITYRRAGTSHTVTVNLAAVQS
ncbi:MAG: S1C family serine protease, partial [Actinomycetes bacterium]